MNDYPGMLGPKKKPFNATASLPLPKLPSAGVSPPSRPVAPLQLPRPGIAPHPSNPALGAVMQPYQADRAGFERAAAAAAKANAAARGVGKAVGAQLIVPRNEFQAPYQMASTPSGDLALKQANAQAAAANQAKQAFVPKLDAHATALRQFADTTNANTVGRQYGVAPIPLPTATPAIKPVMIDPSNPASMQLTPPGRADAAPVGGGAAPLPRPNARQLTGGGAGPAQAGFKSLASSVNAQGNNVYDNASVDRLNARYAAPGSNGGVQAQSFGGTAPLALPTATPAAAPPTLGVNLPRPGVASTYGQPLLSMPDSNAPLPPEHGRLTGPRAMAEQYNSREDRDARAKMLSSLDSRIFAAGINPNSRSKRQLLGSLIGAQAGLVGNGEGLSAGAVQNRNNNDNALGIADMTNQGENQRALLGDANTRDIATQKDQGDTTRVYLQSLAELNKSATITGSDGNLLRVTGGTAAPVVGPDGLPVQTWDARADRPDSNAIISAYTAQKNALDVASASTLKPADYTALDASPLGQAYKKALAPLPLPTGRRTPPAEHIAKLRANPHWAPYFDKEYGKGAAARYLAGGSE